MGPHRKFSKVSRSHFELIPGQGHFGPDALPGVSTADSNSYPCPLASLVRLLLTRMRVPAHRTLGGGEARRSRSGRRATTWSVWKRLRARSLPSSRAGRCLEAQIRRRVCVFTHRRYRKGPGEILGYTAVLSKTGVVYRVFVARKFGCSRIFYGYNAIETFRSKRKVLHTTIFRATATHRVACPFDSSQTTSSVFGTSCPWQTPLRRLCAACPKCSPCLGCFSQPPPRLPMPRVV